MRQPPAAAGIAPRRNLRRLCGLERRRPIEAVLRAANIAAAGVLAVRDLIGRHGFTQEHYDLLTGPWRTVIGPIHPDDAEVAS